MTPPTVLKWIKGAGLMLLVVAVVYGALHMYNQAYQAGYAAGSTKVRAEWQREQLAQLNKVNALNTQVATLQQTLGAQATRLERKTHEEKQAIIDVYERKLAATANATERVYIPAKIPDNYCNNARTGAARTPARVRETRCELDPKVVAHLAAIARDGDLAIIERNALIDHYTAARNALLKQKQIDTTP